ncbi:peptidylprolyl isomerase [bacterium]|nr:peptidylprolyl isomerase [bacterium]
MVNEELLLQEAKTHGYDRDALGQREQELIRQKALVDAYTQHIIHPKVTVADRELEELFIRFNTKITARHLIAQTFAEATELRQRLLDGESYQVLAKEVFEDPVLSNNGGLLPLFTVDDTEPAFEEVAYSLPVGTVSEPIKLKHGYSVIRVESRVRTPMMTRTQFTNKRAELEAFLQRRKLRSAANEHTAWVRDEVLALQFHPEASLRLWQELQGESTHQPDATLSAFTSDGKPIAAVTRDGEIDMKACRHLLDGATEEELNWIDSPDQLEELLTGLMVRRYMVEQAEQAGLGDGPEFEKGVEQMWQRYLLGRMQETLHATQPIPQDSLTAFYAAHTDRYNQPASILLCGIRLSSLDEAKRLEVQMRDGLSFEQAAREWSIDRESGQRGGMLGLFTQRDLGPEVRAVWPLSIGVVYGPVRMPGGGAGFFQVADRREEVHHAYNDIKDRVEADYRAMMGDRLEQDFCAALRKEKDVVIYRDRLLNRDLKGEAR